MFKFFSGTMAVLMTAVMAFMGAFPLTRAFADEDDEEIDIDISEVISAITDIETEVELNGTTMEAELLDMIEFFSSEEFAEIDEQEELILSAEEGYQDYMEYKQELDKG